MDLGRFSTNANRHFFSLPPCGENIGTEAYGKSETFPIKKHSFLLQCIPNRFQRLDFLQDLSTDLVQRLQFGL